MKKVKRCIASLMVMVLFMSICMNSFAAQSYDSGYLIRLQNSSMVLNCHTSQMPISGTNVSTWSVTGNSSQRWIYNMEPSGRYSLRPLSNRTVAVNANRSYEGTTVNVLTVSGNYSYDYTFIALPSSGAYLRMEMNARGGHTKPVAIAAHGDYAYCTWLYSSGVNSLWTKSY